MEHSGDSRERSTIFWWGSHRLADRSANSCLVISRSVIDYIIDGQDRVVHFVQLVESSDFGLQDRVVFMGGVTLFDTVGDFADVETCRLDGAVGALLVELRAASRVELRHVGEPLARRPGEDTLLEQTLSHDVLTGGGSFSIRVRSTVWGKLVAVLIFLQARRSQLVDHGDRLKGHVGLHLVEDQSQLSDKVKRSDTRWTVVELDCWTLSFYFAVWESNCQFGHWLFISSFTQFCFQVCEKADESRVLFGVEQEHRNLK